MWITINSGILWAWYRLVCFLLRKEIEWKAMGEHVRLWWYAGAAVGVLGVLSDVVYNVLYGSFFFLEMPKIWRAPREWTLSQRMKRIRRVLGMPSIRANWTWRQRHQYKLASWVCERVLNPYWPEEGGHC